MVSLNKPLCCCKFHFAQVCEHRYYIITAEGSPAGIISAITGACCFLHLNNHRNVSK